MNINSSKWRSIVLMTVMLLSISALSGSAVKAQNRDYMTEAEIELVRDSQWIDLRIEVLVRMIDRRFTALGIAVGGWKESDKDAKIWGSAPAGTRSELLWDIRQLLQKAIDDVDDTYAHPNADKSIEPPKKGDKTMSDRFPAAVKALSKAARRYLPALKAEFSTTKDEREIGSILGSIEFCEQIIEASEKPANLSGNF